MNKSKHLQSIDAFGQEMRDYYHGKEVVEITERDDGYIGVGVYGVKSYFSEYKDWFPIEKAAIKFARGKVLDIGCGAGRHCLYLQKKGLDVLGIDNSPLAIEVCELRGVKQATVLPFEQVNKLKPQKFDTILMLGHNFGLFGSFKKAQRLLKVLHGITTPKAVIIATVRDPHKTDEPKNKEYHRLNQQRGRMPGQVRLRVRYKTMKSSWFDYLFVSKSELKQILEGTGWRVKKFIDEENKPSYAMILEKI